MSTLTPNLNLVKPELTDPADITAMNGNWDIVERKLLDLATEMQNGIAGVTEMVGNVASVEPFSYKGT